MVSVSTQDGYPRGGDAWKCFPTLDHPPRYVLMGEKHVFDGGTYNFPRLWHQDVWETIPTLTHPSRSFLMEATRDPHQISGPYLIIW